MKQVVTRFALVSAVFLATLSASAHALYVPYPEVPCDSWIEECPEPANPCPDQRYCIALERI